MESKRALRTAGAVAGLCAAALLGLVGPASAADEAPAGGPPPLSAYGHLPSLEQAAISPDGESVAVIYTDGEMRKLLVMRLSDMKITHGFNAGSQKVRGIQWAGSRHVLITVSHATRVMDVIVAKSEWMVTSDFDLDKNVLKPTLHGIDQSMNVSLGWPMIRTLNGHPFAFIPGVYFVQGQGHMALFKADLDRSITTLVDPGFENTSDWIVDQAGEPLAELEHDSDRAKALVRVRRGAAWRPLPLGGGEHLSLLGLGRDGRSALLGDGEEEVSLRELAPGADDWGEPTHLEDGASVLFDPGDDHAIGVTSLVGDEGHYRFFSSADQVTWNAVVQAFPGARVTLASWSADRSKIIAWVDSPTDGPAYVYLDMHSGQAARLGQTYAEASAALNTVTPISFKAQDGTPLTGYLTLPRGREAKNLPLVVFPHGGPAARDEPGFDWWAQAMASRGYAVLQVNYRGSDGFGWKFLSAGFGQWGKAMQTDLSDGVRHLASQGKIDAKRVCIVGASYGGYAALAGATLQPEVYRCAVSVAGISELGRFVSWSREQHDLSAQRYWLRFMGADGVHDTNLADISPGEHAGQVSGPILLIHGKDDTVVPFNQSEMMADALKKAGKPYDFVVLKAEDHWLSRGETRLQMLQAVIDFLEKNNPPG